MERLGFQISPAAADEKIVNSQILLEANKTSALTLWEERVNFTETTEFSLIIISRDLAR